MSYSGADPALHAQLLPTEDPSVFELSGLDNHQLLAHPEGEIELSMGSGFNLDGTPDFSAFSSLFANILGTDSEDSVLQSGEDVSSLLNSFLALSQESQPEEVHQPVEPTSPINAVKSETYAMPLQDASVPSVKKEDPITSKSSSPVLSPSQPNTPASVAYITTPPKLRSVLSTSHTVSPYTPPAGAALASARRVAATWISHSS